MVTVIESIKQESLEKLRPHLNGMSEVKIRQALDQLELSLYSAVNPDDSVISGLKSLSPANFAACINEVVPRHIARPASKPKLIELVNGCIVLGNLRDIIEKFKSTDVKPVKKSTGVAKKSGATGATGKKTTGTAKKLDPTADTKTIRDELLKMSDFALLAQELDKYTLPDLKKICAPWKANLKVGGTVKQDYITAVVAHLKNVRNFTLLGS